MQLAILTHGGEGFLLDTCGTELYSFQHARVENVETGIDAVADELDRLLYEAIDPRVVAGLVHDHTVLGRLFNLCDYDCTLFTMLLVEFRKLSERIFANDIAVENEERSIVLAENLLRKFERAGCA